MPWNHSVGMTESSPAIYRRVYRGKGRRPVGTLDRPQTESHPSLRKPLRKSLFSIPSSRRADSPLAGGKTAQRSPPPVPGLKWASTLEGSQRLSCLRHEILFILLPVVSSRRAGLNHRLMDWQASGLQAGDFVPAVESMIFAEVSFGMIFSTATATRPHGRRGR